MSVAANYAPALDRRPCFPLGAPGVFGYAVCAPPACPVAVGETHRSASHISVNKPGFLLRVFYAAVLIAIACSCSRRQEAVRLLDAAESGDLAKVKALVEQGAPINWTSEMTFGWTPLIGASFHFQTNVIAYLVEKGADVNVADQSGETALMWLMVRGDESVPMVKLLIEHGANLEAKNKAGGTVFDMAHSDQLVQVLEAARKQQKESHKP